MKKPIQSEHLTVMWFSSVTCLQLVMVVISQSWQETARGLKLVTLVLSLAFTFIALLKLFLKSFFPPPHDHIYSTPLPIAHF